MDQFFSLKDEYLQSINFFEPANLFSPPTQIMGGQMNPSFGVHSTGTFTLVNRDIYTVQLNSMDVLATMTKIPLTTVEIKTLSFIMSFKYAIKRKWRAK